MTATLIKGAKPAPKAHRSTMETVILNIDEVNQWRIPPFQRPVRVNDKVQCMAEEIKHGTVSLPGILTLGKLKNDPLTYLVDGQHRTEAFRISGSKEIIADVRMVHFDSLAEMSEEFVQLNSALVRMRPDDMLRGLVPTHPPLDYLRKECPFIGFGQIRRGGDSGPIVSMASALRCWEAAQRETPTSISMSAGAMGMSLTQDSAEALAKFLDVAYSAWGRDPEYYRLWGNLNLALCMWLYRRVVLDTDRRRGGVQPAILSVAQFKQGLMALSADSNYMDWLVRRLLNDRDRSPGYYRIKAVFARRLQAEGHKSVLPAPAWAAKTGGTGRKA